MRFLKTVGKLVMGGLIVLLVGVVFTSLQTMKEIGAFFISLYHLILRIPNLEVPNRRLLHQRVEMLR